MGPRKVGDVEGMGNNTGEMSGGETSTKGMKDRKRERDYDTKEIFSRCNAEGFFYWHFDSINSLNRVAVYCVSVLLDRLRVSHLRLLCFCCLLASVGCTWFHSHINAVVRVRIV